MRMERERGGPKKGYGDLATREAALYQCVLNGCRLSDDDRVKYAAGIITTHPPCGLLFPPRGGRFGS